MMKHKKWLHIALIAVIAVCVSVVFTLGDSQVSAATTKPGKVYGVKATASSFNAVKLTWKKATGAQAYKVYKASYKNGIYREIKTIKKTECTIGQPELGKTYWFKIRALNSKGKGKPSQKVKGGTSLGVPKITGKSTSRGATISATKVRGADGYVFYRNGAKVAVQKSTIFVDKGTVKDNTYYNYTAAAVKKVGTRTYTSGRSNTVKALKEVWNIAIQDELTVPKTISQGTLVTIGGNIKSNLKIKQIEIGVVKKNSNGNWAWVSCAKYVNKNVNKTSFDIAEADDTVKFSKLKKGTYKYRIYAHNANGTVNTLENTKFKVKKNPALKAVAWAKKYAADDTYCYGTIVDRGCALCGTSAKHKGKSHANTWTCAPFIGAAYAHGAGDPDLMALCCEQAYSRSPVALNNDNFNSKYFTVTGETCWTKVGLCKNLSVSDLQVGDVIVSWNHHVCMYIGNGYIVHAHTKGWGANSIEVEPKAATWLAKAASKSSKSYVMRYNK